MLIKEVIKAIEVSEEEHDYFVRSCSDWGRFCEFLSSLNRYMTMKLIKYLMEERPYSKNVLSRSIGRFNSLNKLRKEDLLDEEPIDTEGNTEGDKKISES